MHFPIRRDGIAAIPRRHLLVAPAIHVHRDVPDRVQLLLLLLLDERVFVDKVLALEGRRSCRKVSRMKPQCHVAHSINNVFLRIIMLTYRVVASPTDLTNVVQEEGAVHGSEGYARRDDPAQKLEVLLPLHLSWKRLAQAESSRQSRLR